MALCCGVGTQGVPRATQNHNMGVFMKRIKIKMIRCYHRCKNKIVYVYKRVRVPFVAFLMCFSLLACTLFACKQTAYATGVEEMLYYTYWDLVSGLFSEVGYQYSVTDEYYTSPNRASGEQIWDNFCTWVENKAKALSLPVAVVHDELKNLPNVVTEAGVNMSEKLAEILAKVLPTAVDENNSLACVMGESSLSKDSTAQLVASICGTSVSSVPIDYIYTQGAYMNIVRDSDGFIKIFWSLDPISHFIDGHMIYSTSGSCGAVYGVVFNKGRFSTSQKIYPWASDIFLVKNCCLAQSVYSRVKVKEKYPPDDIYVPGVGWKTNWDIWRDIVLPSHVTTDEEEAEWNSRYNFDNDNEDKKKQKKDNNKKDRLPVVIPIVLPHKKDDKEDTEDSTEESTEKDTEGVVVPIPTPDPTEDSSEDSTQDSTQDEDYEDVVNSAEKGGNWKRLFPFCIPWDIMTLVQSMNAEKKAPHFKFKHRFEMINYTFQFDVDMSKYWKYIKIFRWGMTIFFIIGLFFLTVKFTTFVHRGN